MTEFQPENTTPDPHGSTNAAAPYKGMPDLQGQPFDPRGSYAQQPAAPDAAPPAQQAAPPAQPFGDQPYGQAAPMAAALQNPAWGAPPPAWSPAPAKKRKAWPWVLGIVGGLVVLGGVGTAVAFGVNGALHADQNDNYTGAPIATGDAPVLGDQVFISDSGTVAFETGSGWFDANSIVDAGGASSGLPDGTSMAAAYFTADPATAGDVPPTLVLVIEGAPAGQVGPADVKAAHDGAVSGVVKSFNSSGTDVTSTGPESLTTANGLDGMVSTVSGTLGGMQVRLYGYTFARGERVVFVQVASYTGELDDATAAMVTESLRIDK